MQQRNPVLQPACQCPGKWRGDPCGFKIERVVGIKRTGQGIGRVFKHNKKLGEWEFEISSHGGYLKYYPKTDKKKQ